MIGERLEEARKRKGVTIREAAEATKIRGDYLLSMEDNSFDIPLPQIYVRGFLKNYAQFLKVDPNKILTDYDAHQLGRNAPVNVPPGRSSGSESLGRVELKDQHEDDDDLGDEAPVVVTEAPEDTGPDPEMRFSLDREAQPKEPTPPPPTLEKTSTRHDQESFNENKTLYLKIGIVFAGILLVSIILIVLIQLLSGGKETPAINPDLAETANVPSVTETTPGAITKDTILITASDNVTLIVEQTLDRKRLWSGSLNAGEPLSLEKEGPVSIRYTNGEALVISKDGRQFRPGQAGVGRTVVE